MPNGWHIGKFGDVLERVSRPVQVEPDMVYRCLGVQWYAKGLFVREAKAGHEIRARELYQIELGDLVYNRLFAWKGSFAIAGSDTAGGFVSGEFPVFRVNALRADPSFLHLYLSQEKIWTEMQRISSGQTNISRLRLKEPVFLRMEVPLPPLDEQRRIAQRVDSLAGRIARAQALRRAVLQEGDLLLRSMLADKSFGPPVLIPMRELLRLRDPDILVDPNETYQFAGVYSFGRGCFRGTVRTGGQFAYRTLTRLRTDDFTYPKLMAWEGAYAIVPPECDGLVVSTEFPVFELDKSKVLPATLAVYFRDPAIWETLSGQSTGTNVRRRRLNPQVFLNHKFPLPPMQQQLALQRVATRLAALTPLQAETQRELDALLPSILDKAFKGEL